MQKHPYIETAEILEAVIKDQRWHDKRNDGVMLFSSEESERATRERIAELRDLARRDRLAGTWPPPKEEW